MQETQMDLGRFLKRFRSAFDSHWRSALAELGSAQAQLTTGSRLRPQLALLGYLAAIEPERWQSDDLSLIANVTVSIELIHKASLFLDDWIDDDARRHGLPAFHTENTPERTVMLAMKMVGLSTYRLRGVFSEDTVLPQHYFLCLNTLIETIYSMASGAYRELTLCDDDRFDFATAREIAQLETAEIIGNSLLIGFYCGAGERKFPAVEAQFKQIGDKCGYIFQAMNDLEAFSKPEKLELHKGRLNLDVSENHKNMAIALLYQIASKKDRAALKTADGEVLLHLSRKYRITEYYMRELETTYASLVGDAAALSSMGLSLAWCDLFHDFLGIIKTTAGARL